MPVLFSTTTTAQQIMNATSQDVRNQLSGINAPDNVVILDYVNRVSLEMLQLSKWIFLLSTPQQFVTQLGVSSYWIGPTGTGPSNAYDTGLNLSDVRNIKPKSVLDRSNFRKLGQADEQPLAAKLGYPDATMRPGRPALWRQDETTPNVLNIYPAADNQNTYSPQPISPICTTTPGGALANRIYFVTVTFIDSFGSESTAPFPTEIFVPAGRLLVVNGPVEPLIAGTTGVQYNRYNVYASSAGANETVEISGQNTTQQATLIATSSTWTEPTSGLTTIGPPPPGTNSVEPITGYIIEFRYYRQRAQLTLASQVIQIPDDYRHVVIAGTNAYVFQYLFRAPESQRWYQLYQDGIAKIIRDINFMSKGGEYISPDGASVGGFLPAVEVVDLGLLLP